MTRQLYLDTARLGLMTATAQRAHTDFARLAGEEGASAAFDRFLRHGFGPGRSDLAERFPGLADWKGVGALKAKLRKLAGSRPELPVLLANRSTQLMRLAARLLCLPCRSVLVTDVGWPPYQQILAAECRRAGRDLVVVPLLGPGLEGRLSAHEVTEVIRNAVAKHRCDGLFLPAVGHLGLRLPIDHIVRAAEGVREMRFVVIDGSQDFCHVGGVCLADEGVDLFLSGSHKWLGSGYPLGLAFYGRRRSRSFIETILGRLLEDGVVDDPLLRFSADRAGDATIPVSETVDVAPLFSCQGAAGDALAGAISPAGHLPRRLENLTAAAEVVAGTGWRAILPDASLRSGILLLESERDGLREASADSLRYAFHDRGVSLTAYEGGRVRVSMPPRPWSATELKVLKGACTNVA